MARPDLDALLNAALPFAQKMLVERGQFYPFGATMKPDGKIDQTAGWTGEEFPQFHGGNGGFWRTTPDGTGKHGR